MAKLDPYSRTSLRFQSNPDFIELNPRYKGNEIDDSHNDFFWRQQEQQHFFETKATGFHRFVSQLSQYFRQLHMQSPSIAATLFLSIIVFVAWQIPRAQPFLLRHFICSGSNLVRSQSLLLASISHKELYHLLVNYMVLLSFGPSVQQAIAPKPVWPILVGASLSGSAMYLFMGYVLQGQRYSKGCLGLSAVTLALTAFWARLHPEGTMRFLVGPIPVTLPANRALYALVAWSLVAALFPMMTGGDLVAHSGHLGGLLFGYLYYEWWLSQRRPRRQKCKLSSNPFGEKDT